MVKKIMKYAKFVVCCALIVSLIAPSYAGLSASDGAAFVTKAEFDAALADFNSRLTTFEAGINSKIDSQVTSYLDRNGIWNGKEQIITSNLFKNELKSNNTTVTGYYMYQFNNSDASWNKSYSTFYEIYAESTPSSGTTLFTASKSGLAYFVVQLTDMSISLSGKTWIFCDASIYPAAFWLSVFYIKKNSDDWLTADGYIKEWSAFMGAYNKNATSYKTTLVGFCSKGDIISVVPLGVLNKYKIAFYTSNTMLAGRSMQVLSCSIY